jgi:hypothetical protein
MISSGEAGVQADLASRMLAIEFQSLNAVISGEANLQRPYVLAGINRSRRNAANGS